MSEYAMDQYVGRTDIIANVTSLLGSTGIVQDLFGTGNAPRTILSACPIQVRIVRNNSGGTLSKSTVVKWKAGYHGTQVDVVAGATEIGCGIVDPFLSTTVANGDTFLLFEAGPALVLASAAITAGTAIMTAAAGKVVTRTTLSTPATVVQLAATVGYMLEAATADGEYKRAFLQFSEI